LAIYRLKIIGISRLKINGIAHFPSSMPCAVKNDRIATQETQSLSDEVRKNRGAGGA
jgi:hypothetical protein